VIVVTALILALVMPKEKEYVISFNINGQTTTQILKEGEYVSVPQNPVLEGYNFIRWECNGNPYDFSKPVEKDIVLVAKFEKIVIEEGKEYTVLFDTDDGSTVPSQKIKSGEKIQEPEKPLKPGYIFEGWLLNGQPFDFNTIISKDIKLDAKWKKETAKYTVSFNSNGGSAVKSQTVEEGKTIAKPTNPTRSGYKFAGWTLNGKAYNFGNKVTGNITLTASWTKIEKLIAPEIEIKEMNSKPILVIRRSADNAEKETLVLERSVNGGSYTEVEASLIIVGGYGMGKYEQVHELDKYTNNVSFRAKVKKTDSNGKEISSEYTKVVTYEYKDETSILIVPEIEIKEMNSKPVLVIRRNADNAEKETLVLERSVNGGSYTQVDSSLIIVGGYGMGKYEQVHELDTYTNNVSFRAKVKKTDSNGKEISSEFSNVVTYVYKEEEKSIPTPTLSKPQGGPGFAILSVKAVGAYAPSDMWDLISGIEVYEKEGSKLTLIYTSETELEPKVTVDKGESKKYVARIYSYNKSNKKIYSDYSNEVTLEYKIPTPTLSKPQGGPGFATLSVQAVGSYAPSDMWDLISGLEVYEKIGSELTLIYTSETDFTPRVTVDVGESKTFVARIYSYNKSNNKVYSDYSNEVTLEYIEN
ncbi:MAG: InlB B-repeat-containing protein, partial [Clostridia bacterium]|nr:InlB B-repeat-containing protein [Clostridia bacterium]